MATRENLQKAFAGESQANRKYLAFAKKAETEGYPQVAKLFRAAAEAETVHALAHLRAMGGVKSTQGNLQQAIEGENYEFQEMYPEYVENARAENSQQALTSFKNAMAVEQVHHSLYLEASKSIQEGKDMPAAKVFVCNVCGNTVLNEVPDKCPVCSASRDQFTEIQ
jgi:rubrerythrin